MSQKNEPNPVRIDIFIQDVMRISGCSPSTASRKIQLCKDALSKQRHQALSIKEFCQYYGYDYLTILKQLELL